MSTEGTATQAQPVRLTHRRTVVEGFPYDGSDDTRRAIIAWSAGKCFETNGTKLEFWCDSPNGRRQIYPGDTVIHGILDEYYPVPQQLIDAAYDQGNGPAHIGRFVEQLEDIANTVDNYPPELLASDEVFVAAQRLGEFLDTALAAAQRARMDR